MPDYTPEIIREAAQRANSSLVTYFRDTIPGMLNRHHTFVPRDVKSHFALSSDLDRYLNGGLLDGGFINRIGGLYTPEERAFIQDVAGRFERVKLGFAYFGLMRSTLRPLEALRLANYQYRAGWQKTGVPLGFNQDVGEHQESVRRLAFLLFFDDPKIELVERVCSFHDVGEAVIGDFTPRCEITKPEKAMIEDLGVRLITKTARDYEHPIAEWMHEVVEIYEERKPEHADVQRMVKDCDLLDMAMEAVFLMGNAPQAERTALNEKLQEFWDYIGPRLSTPRAQNFFAGLIQHRHDLNLTETSVKDVWIKAHRHMMQQEPDMRVAKKRFEDIARAREMAAIQREAEFAARMAEHPKIIRA